MQHRCSVGIPALLLQGSKPEDGQEEGKDWRSNQCIWEACEEVGADTELTSRASVAGHVNLDTMLSLEDRINWTARVGH